MSAVCGQWAWIAAPAAASRARRCRRLQLPPAMSSITGVSAPAQASLRTSGGEHRAVVLGELLLLLAAPRTALAVGGPWAKLTDRVDGGQTAAFRHPHPHDSPSHWQCQQLSLICGVCARGRTCFASVTHGSNPSVPGGSAACRLVHGAPSSWGILGRLESSWMACLAVQKGRVAKGHPAVPGPAGAGAAPVLHARCVCWAGPIDVLRLTATLCTHSPHLPALKGRRQGPSNTLHCLPSRCEFYHAATAPPIAAFPRRVTPRQPHVSAPRGSRERRSG